MKSLSQLLAEQRAAGLTPLRADDESVPVGQVVTPRPTVTPVEFLTKAVEASGGFVRLLPPGVEVPSPTWVAENWSRPSPWCRLQGLPEHEDFSKNLLASKA